MRSVPRPLIAAVLAVVIGASASGQAPTADWDMAAKIREEGLQRSQVMDIVGYMTDVLGGRLSLSEDMKRAQLWAKDKMEKLGLENVVIEPFMDYGAAWDNEYFSLHMLEPDYIADGRASRSPTRPGPRARSSPRRSSPRTSRRRRTSNATRASSKAWSCWRRRRSRSTWPR